MAVLSDALRGDWSVTRAINGEADVFVGTATFTVEQDGLWWRERGRMRVGDYTGEAHRTYVIVDGEVRFEDGRPFHPIDLAAARCEALHLCGPDTYRGVYEVLSAARFRVVWRVTGPGRDDRIVCDYRRL